MRAKGITPLSDAQKGTGTCLFVMGGFFWLFFIPSAEPQALEYRFCLSEEGELTLVVEEDYTEKFLVSFAVDLKKSGNLPSI